MAQLNDIKGQLDTLEQVTTQIGEGVAAAQAEYAKLVADLESGVTPTDADTIVARIKATNDKLTPFVDALKAIGTDPENPIPPAPPVSPTA